MYNHQLEESLIPYANDFLWSIFYLTEQKNKRIVVCIFYTEVPNAVFRHVEDQIVSISSSLAISPTGHGTWGVLGRADVLLRAASQRVHTTVTDLKDERYFSAVSWNTMYDLGYFLRLRLPKGRTSRRAENYFNNYEQLSYFRKFTSKLYTVLID